MPVSFGLQGSWTLLPPGSRRCLEAAHGKETGLLLRVRMEAPHFWAVVEGDVIVLNSVFLEPIFQTTVTMALPLKKFFSETIKYRGKSMHRFWNQTS